MSKKKESRWRDLNEHTYRFFPNEKPNWQQIFLMGIIENYCMVKTPRGMPFVLSLKEWEKLPIEEPTHDQRA